jgi:hypothetical protein
MGECDVAVYFARIEPVPHFGGAREPDRDRSAARARRAESTTAPAPSRRHAIARGTCHRTARSRIPSQPWNAHRRAGLGAPTFRLDATPCARQGDRRSRDRLRRGACGAAFPHSLRVSSRRDAGTSSHHCHRVIAVNCTRTLGAFFAGERRTGRYNPQVPYEKQRAAAGVPTQSLLALAIWGGCFGCAPLNPSTDTVVGQWRVDWTCGVETLNLAANGTYSYTIDFAAGGRETDSGEWTIIPKTERLSAARVRLQNAVQACSYSGEKLPAPGRANRDLETIWEWGRTILSFDPDGAGFTRM